MILMRRGVKVYFVKLESYVKFDVAFFIAENFQRKLTKQIEADAIA